MGGCSEQSHRRLTLRGIPQRAAIEARLTELWNYERFSAPYQKAGRYFFRRNDGLQNQSVLYTTTDIHSEPEVLLDPNSWSEDGTVALSSYAVSDDGRLIAHSVSEAGSDWKVIKLMEVDSGKQLEDVIRWVRWGSVTWSKDGTGFYYSRYPQPDADEKYQAVANDMMVYYHVLGTSQDEDKLIYKRPDHPDWTFSTSLTHDGKYLILSISKSTDDQNQVYYRLATDDGDFTPLIIDDFENQFWFHRQPRRSVLFLHGSGGTYKTCRGNVVAESRSGRANGSDPGGGRDTRRRHAPC